MADMAIHNINYRGGCRADLHYKIGAVGTFSLNPLSASTIYNQIEQYFNRTV
jgi:hypothetical protein